ncbi:MAG: thiamine phosphate synthase [Vicinamibacterales bacterium]
MPVLPPLYPIVDVGLCDASGRDPVAYARALMDGGARLLQVRAKALGGRAFLDLLQEVGTLAEATGARIVVNDRADLAALVSAAGVHVGQDDLAPAAVRRVAGEGVVVGLSTHTEAQAAAALAAPIDYLAIGPVYGTRTKDTGYDAVGLDMVARVSALAGPRGLPVVAIGGITLDRAAAVWAAGADSVAVIGDLMTADPAARVAEWLAAAARRPSRA